MYCSLEDFVSARKKAVDDGLESKELAALMIEKFAEGMGSCGENVISDADKYCLSIDPLI